MAKGQAEAPVGTRTRRNRRERESRQGGQTSSRRRTQEPQARAPPPPEGPTSQQIGDQTAPQEEGSEGIWKGVPHVTKIQKVIPIRPQITSVQLHEDRNKAHQTPGKRLSPATLEPCPASGILAPLQTSRITYLPFMRNRTRDNHPLPDALAPLMLLKDNVYGTPWAETKASASKYWAMKNESNPL